MSSPFGHSLVGCAIAALASKKFSIVDFRMIFLYVFIANAADLDFLPGILIGNPNLYHHGISHSLGAGALLSFLLAIFIRGKRSKNLKRNFLLFFSVYGTHLFLDYLSQDGRPPIGIPLFWPISAEYYISPYPILPPVLHSVENATIGQFLKEAFSIHNVYVFFLEFIAILPVFLISLGVRLRQHKRLGITLL